MTIAAVVVTHNRLNMLKQCIESLVGQTRIPNKIIVVDNGSTDGTGRWLSAQRGLTVISQPNLGSAGGFHEGLRVACMAGHEWLLLLDDDCVLDIGYIERGTELLKALRSRCFFDSVGCGYVYERYRGVTFFGVRNGVWLAEPLSGEPYESDELGFPFMLLHRSVVERAGLPYKFWFIVNDDSEWVWRMRRYGFKLYMLPVQAGTHHAERRSVQVKFLSFARSVTLAAPWKTYYFIRNGIIFDRIKGDSRLVVLRKYAPKVAARIFYPERSVSQFFSALKGLWDGVLFQLPRDDPRVRV